MENYIFQTRNLVFQDKIYYNDISIPANKVNFIVGRSGSGKSTLLRMLNGTLSQSSGEIFYKGTNLAQLDTIELRKKVSLISQSVYLFDLNIRDNFRMFYNYRNMPSPSDDVIRKYLELCNISFPLDKDCTTMSGGERQRVYIAIFLSFLPKVLMMDEPTSALDKESSQIVIGNVLNFCKEQGITVIIISHDGSLTKEFAENIIKIGKNPILFLL